MCLTHRAVQHLARLVVANNDGVCCSAQQPLHSKSVHSSCGKCTREWLLLHECSPMCSPITKDTGGSDAELTKRAFLSRILRASSFSSSAFLLLAYTRHAPAPQNTTQEQHHRYTRVAAACACLAESTTAVNHVLQQFAMLRNARSYHQVCIQGSTKAHAGVRVETTAYCVISHAPPLILSDPQMKTGQKTLEESAWYTAMEHCLHCMRSTLLIPLNTQLGRATQRRRRSGRTCPVHVHPDNLYHPVQVKARQNTCKPSSSICGPSVPSFQ